MTQREVMRPLRVPPFAWCCGSTALAANTFGTYLEKERVWQELLAFIQWLLCFNPNDALHSFYYFRSAESLHNRIRSFKHQNFH